MWCSLEKRPAQAFCSECTASWEQEAALRLCPQGHSFPPGAPEQPRLAWPLFTWFRLAWLRLTSAPVRCWPQRREPLTVCPVFSSRIFFPGCHPVRGVQVMKVGKLQLHQGMFPQAMKNLRLVSAHRVSSA